MYNNFLEEFNKQLEAKGVIIKYGSIVNPSITNTPFRPLGGKIYEVIEDRKENENNEVSKKVMVKEAKCKGKEYIPFDPSLTPTFA